MARLLTLLDLEAAEPAGPSVGADLEPSDIRLKDDVAEVGRLPNGLGLYRFRYAGHDETYVGVMAHEVAEVEPEAVVRGDDGYLRVDYDRLGLRLVTWKEWQERKPS